MVKFGLRKFAAKTCCLFVLLIIFVRQLQVLPREIQTSSAEVEPHSNGNKTNELMSSYCLPENKQDQADPCLVNHVKKSLIPPSYRQLRMPVAITYNKLAPTSSIERLKFIEKYLIRKGHQSSPQGFFIEAGANDGEFLSNTLDLELKYNWTGLLIEPNPVPFKKLVAMHRNAWSLNHAICTTTHSDKVMFHINQDLPGGGSFIRGKDHRQDFYVPCVPLYTMLLALNVTSVDFLSLDVQGVELEILKAVPFDKVIFKVMVLEHNMVKGYQPALILFLEKREYKFIGSQLDTHTVDSLFVHASIFTPNMALKIKYHNITS